MRFSLLTGGKAAPGPSGLIRLMSKAADVQTIVFVLIWLAMGGVFFVDVATPPDDVSICFVYAVLISASIFSFRSAAYLSAALATVLSLLGAFIQTPGETLSLVFFANRAIAVAAQWVVAFLVTARKDTEALMRAEYEEERRKVETSHRFIDVLSHEIGTSLTMIDGHAFRLKKLVRGDEPHNLTGRADKIREAVSHIEAVVRQVQMASEADQGKLHFRPAVFKPGELVADVVTQFEAERTIQSDLARLPLAVWGDADMVRQVIANLLSNAIKYSSAVTPIVIHGRTQDNFAVLSIADQGRGVPNDEKLKLFEPYFRASNSRGVPGTGIGLYLVERYVATHGGSISFDSELGTGTTVTVRIPIGKNSIG